MKDDKEREQPKSLYGKRVNISLPKAPKTSQEGGAYLNRAAKGVVGAASLATGRPVAEQIAGRVKGVAKGIPGFVKGAVTGDPGNDNPEPAGYDGMDRSQYRKPSLFTNDPLAGTKQGAPTPDASQNTEPYRPAAPVENNDPRAAQYLAGNSEAASGDLNAGRRRVVPGMDGTSYAGRYGDTEVFAGTTTNEQGEKVTNFSDRANLATTRGGAAASIPEGRTAVTNTSPAAMGPVDLDGDGLPDQVSPELQAGRAAALKRGDYEAYDRSMMTSGQRAQVDRQAESDRLRQAAAEQDPVNTYLGEVQADTTRANARQDAERYRVKENREQTKLQNKAVSDAWSYLEPQLKNDFGETDPQKASAVQAALAEVAKRNPWLGPMSLAEMAMAQLQSPQETVAAGDDVMKEIEALSQL